MDREQEIERSVEEMVKSFLKAAGKLPELKETYYSRESYNVVRPDGEPKPAGELAEFRKRFISTAPGTDRDGNLKVEVAKWA